MRNFIILISLLQCLGTIHGQGNALWKSWNDVMVERGPTKKYVVEITTPWCTVCKKLENSSFKNPIVTSILEESYHVVKLNAESTDTYTYKGKTYKSRQLHGKIAHDLARKLTGGKLRYPTLVFLDEEQNILQSIAGYQDASTLALILKYFGDDFHLTTPWKAYVKSQTKHN